MKHEKSVMIFVLMTVFASPMFGYTRKYQTEGIPCGNIPAVCEALKIEDAFQREKAVYQALAETLLSPDEDTRTRALRFIGVPQLWDFKEITIRIDPRNLRDALFKMDEIDRGHQGSSLLAETMLYFAPREERIRYYRQAIIDGEAPIGEHFGVLRQIAVEYASREGLGELRSLIEEYYPKVPQSGYEPLEYLLLSIDLRDGGVDRADADALAVERLAALPPEKLWNNLVTLASSWRRLTFQIRRLVCREPSSKPCSTMQKAISNLKPFLDEMTAKRLAGYDRLSHKPMPRPSEHETSLRALIENTSD